MDMTCVSRQFLAIRQILNWLRAMHPNRLVLAALLALVTASFATTATAQTAATLTATIKDSTGAALPGATVTLSLEQCKCSECKDDKKCGCCPEQDQVTTSDDRGNVQFQVVGGTFKLRIELTGFKTVEVSKIEVSGGRARHLDVSIQ